MEGMPRLQLDRNHLEHRAFARGDRCGWFARWRPSRALETVPAFSYVTKSEHFDSEGEAIEFIRKRAGRS